MARRNEHRCRDRMRRACKGVFALTLTVLVIVGGYVVYVAIHHTHAVTLPAATDAAYGVGRVQYDWTDRSRIDPLAGRRVTPRELSVWLWYPTSPRTSGQPAPYLPGAWAGLHFPSPIGIGETSFDVVRVSALQGAPVASGRFPIVIFEPGLGLAAPQYTTIAENLAAQGYLVAGVTPTYSANLTVLNGRAVRSSPAGNPSALDASDLHNGAALQAGDQLTSVWAADARFAAAQVAALRRSSRFVGHVNPKRELYIGHSLGGAAALQACHDDRRCVGAVDLDGTQFGPVVTSGLKRPSLIIESESCITGVCSPAGRVDRADQATAQQLLAASTGRAWCYRIDGMRHFNFSDYAAYYLAAPVRRLVPLGSIDGDRGLMITGSYLAAFANHVAKHRPASQLDQPDNRFPEVHSQSCQR
jgi:predicted dienelactone hydrolase